MFCCCWDALSFGPHQNIPQHFALCCPLKGNTGEGIVFHCQVLYLSVKINSSVHGLLCLPGKTWSFASLSATPGNQLSKLKYYYFYHFWAKKLLRAGNEDIIQKWNDVRNQFFFPLRFSGHPTRCTKCNISLLSAVFWSPLTPEGNASGWIQTPNAPLGFRLVILLPK